MTKPKKKLTPEEEAFTKKHEKEHPWRRKGRKFEEVSFSELVEHEPLLELRIGVYLPRKSSRATDILASLLAGFLDAQQRARQREKARAPRTAGSVPTPKTSK